VKTEYDILAAETPVQLAEAVRLHIADGWEPVGGVAVTEQIDRWENERKGGTDSCLCATWAQAVIRRAHPIGGEP
jgi:hypothetical protein